MKLHLLPLILLLLVLVCADVLACMPKRKLPQETTPRKRSANDTNTPPLTLNKNQIVFGKRLGKKKQIRDRVILKANASGKNAKKWTKLLASLDKEINALESKIVTKPTIRDVRVHEAFSFVCCATLCLFCLPVNVIHELTLQVYNLLETRAFKDSPFPIPPSAILFHLPIVEVDGPKKKNRESVLREMVSRDKTVEAGSPWEFQDVNAKYPPT